MSRTKALGNYVHKMSLPIGGITEAAGQTGGCHSSQQAETGHCHCPKTWEGGTDQLSTLLVQPVGCIGLAVRLYVFINISLIFTHVRTFISLQGKA